ncbi:MAG: GNAT family N-acetyltransferase [Burkholderiaceae bacterium]|nr:GNAT family N-acetyltransferase [Burkholderiaceae bacterium]
MGAFYAESDDPLDVGWAAASFRTLITQPALGAVWLAQADSGAVGHAVLTVRHAMEFGGPLGVVDDLYVAPAWRRRGIAGALLDALRGECRLRECKAWQVEVGADNAGAQALYRRFGFAPVSSGRQLQYAGL